VGIFLYQKTAQAGGFCFQKNLQALWDNVGTLLKTIKALGA
jgi:hypothetical protein